MRRNLRVRNLSVETHRVLKARATREDRSLSDLVREELDRIAARPSRRELFARIQEREHPQFSSPLADAVRRMRERAD